MNIKIEEKQKKVENFELGYSALDKSKELKEKKHYKKSLSQIKIAIEYFRNCLAKKPHCKESRKGLLLSWDMYVVNFKFNGSDKFIDESILIKKSIPKIPSLRVAVIDKFVENEWKKQVNGKYGGPKPSNLSWRQFYNILEKEFEAFDELGKKVSWCVQNGHINLLQTLLINPSFKSKILLFEIELSMNSTHLLASISNPSLFRGPNRVFTE